MQNKPQLSAEMQSKYNELRPYIKSGVVQEKIDEVFNWFAATLVEKQTDDLCMIGELDSNLLKVGEKVSTVREVIDEIVAILNEKEAK